MKEIIRKLLFKVGLIKHKKFNIAHYYTLNQQVDNIINKKREPKDHKRIYFI